jgi:hypothetical protein
LVQKNVDEANRYAQQLQNSRGNNFSKPSSANEWQPMTREEIRGLEL